MNSMCGGVMAIGLLVLILMVGINMYVHPDAEGTIMTKAKTLCQLISSIAFNSFMIIGAVAVVIYMIASLYS